MIQDFALRQTVINYIIANANSKVAAKLYQTCKYFPPKFNFFIVDSLRHTFGQDVLTLGDESMKVDTEDVDSYKNLWISEQLISVTNDIGLSTWISNISRCTIYHLEIRARHLTMNDFEILTNSGTVEHIEINKVYYENGTQVPLEVLLSRVPKATFIVIEYTHVTPFTMDILAETEREFKIGYCSLRNIDGMINDKDYYQFMRKNAVKEAQFFVQFDENDVTPVDAKKFGVSVKCKNFYSKDPNPKPFFSYCV